MPINTCQSFRYLIVLDWLATAHNTKKPILVLVVFSSLKAKMKFISFCCLAFLIGHQQILAQNWPSSESLLNFFPYDSKNGINDIVTGKQPGHVFWPQLETSKLGPFGIANSSYTVTKSNAEIARYDSMPSFPSFTVSAYFYVSGKSQNGGILYAHGNNVQNRFSLVYNGFSLELHRFEKFQEWPVTFFTIDNFFKGWTFICFSYDDSTQTVTFYNQLGDPIHIETRFPILNQSGWLFYTGFGRSTHVGFGLQRDDALACTMIYTKVLKKAEIAQLPGVCYQKGQGPSADSTSPQPSTSTTSTRPMPDVIPWPEPDSLIGFWPLSEQYKLEDVSGKGFETSSNQLSLVSGPHGKANSAIASSSSSKAVLEIEDGRLSTNDDSFTVAFFIRTANDYSSGGIFEFIDSQFGTTSKSFQIYYSNYTVTISANKNIIGQYQLLQRQSTWTFLAFTFNDDTSELTVFSKHGVAYQPTIQPFILGSNTLNNGGIRLGYSTIVGKGLNVNDAVSCLSIYGKALDWPQIKQLQQACRIVHGSALAGAPKLPHSPIPSISNPPITTVPKEGQFPWLGTVSQMSQVGQILCTVSILDEYWVLTMASCIPTDNFDHFFVKVGVHDNSVSNGFTTEHDVAAIKTTGNSQRDIALIQLKTPIDFTSDYVNVAQLFDGDLTSIQVHNTQFMSGWGINGRNTFISDSLPRYIAGTILTDGQCSRAWNQSFDPSVDYCFQSSTTDRNVPCKGDQGSPLMYQGESNQHIGLGDRLIQVREF